MARTGDSSATPPDLPGAGVDPGYDEDIVAHGAGMADKFPQIWAAASRYVRRGDGLYIDAGLALVREFAYRLPHMEAAELIESYFERSGYTPRTGNGPPLAAEAFRAAVAVGLVEDYLGDESTDSERRQRMMAVVARALAVAPSPRDKALVQRAFRALEQRNADWWVSPSSQHDSMLRGRRMDPELVERCIDAFEDGRHDEAIRAAMIVLEERLRTSANLPETMFGAGLVKAAIGPNSELNFGKTDGDRKGLHEFFDAPLRLFRNPNAHHFIEHEPDRAFEILSVVDLALDLLAEANTRLYQPILYLRPDEEGESLRVERVFHADINADGTDERLLVCSSGPAGSRRLIYLLLRKDGAGWVRLPIADTQPGYAYANDSRLLEIYETSLCGDNRKQVVISAAAATGGDVGTMHVLDWRDGQACWLRTVPDVPGPMTTQAEIMFELEGGLPELRDADGDGVPEVYVRRIAVLAPYRTPVSVSYLEVFAWDGTALALKDRRPIGDPPLSSIAYEFFRTLEVNTADTNRDPAAPA